eukprot:CAMPEP_0195301190 /NCGR_PEP_ID=MMETSP0707-20130614/28835_1 /TAXON_ID=33640 /ORGANISM="Asterionellopsis glacialis, Strain CCMP134" /LENGTH=96 /DNA_ID=CAMNT_0040364063 /DNA_START=21 /DNA_END=307 /DNA_ORIENTATION=-
MPLVPGDEHSEQVTARLQQQFLRAEMRGGDRGAFDGTPAPAPQGLAQRHDGPTSMPRNEASKLQNPGNKNKEKATTEEVDASELLLSFAGGGGTST